MLDQAGVLFWVTQYSRDMQGKRPTVEFFVRYNFVSERKQSSILNVIKFLIFCRRCWTIKRLYHVYRFKRRISFERNNIRLNETVMSSKIIFPLSFITDKQANKSVVSIIKVDTFGLINKSIFSYGVKDQCNTSDE